MKKQRQPLCAIGAQNLWDLACSAATDVENGDAKDPYVKKIRELSERAAGIAYRALKRKGMTPHGPDKKRA